MDTTHNTIVFPPEFFWIQTKYHLEKTGLLNSGYSKLLKRNKESASWAKMVTRTSICIITPDEDKPKGEILITLTQLPIARTVVSSLVLPLDTSHSLCTAAAESLTRLLW
jgi:hypothetical protein